MRSLRIVAGLLLLAGGVAAEYGRAPFGLEGWAAGGASAGGMILIVLGVLLVLSGLNRVERPAFDPQPLLADRPWSNSEEPWSVGEALGMATWVFRKAGGKLALLMLPVPIAAALAAAGATVAIVLAMGAGAARGAPTTFLGSGTTAPAPSAPWWMNVLAGLGAQLVTAVVLSVVAGPIIKIVLAALRKETVGLADGFPAFRYAPRLIGFGLPFAIGWVLTSPLLTLPVLPFVFTPYFIVDQDLGLVAALRKSWRTGTHHFGKVWLLFFAFLPLRLIGELTWFGVVVSTPMVITAIGYGYLRMTGRLGIPYFPPDAGSRFTRGFLRASLLLITAVFAGLVFYVMHLPHMRGSAFNVLEAALRATTIVTQIIVVVLMLALILPYVLDQMEGRRFTTFVAARHVRAQKSGFLTVISLLSICGVAISSCALSSVVSVMGGFSQDLRRKILGSGAHVVVDTTAGTSFEDYEDALARIRKIQGVVGATPVVHGEVMASSASNLAGVVVTGIEPSSIHSVIDLAQNVEVGKVEYLEHPELLMRLPPTEVIGLGPGGEHYYKGAELPGMTEDIDPSVRAVLLPTKADRPGIILGRELAKTLHVYVGDEMTLVSPLGDLGPMGIMPRTKKFRVAAIFYSGMYEYDATFVYTMMDVAQDYFQTGGKVSALEVKVDDAERVERITPQVTAAVARDDLRVRDWREINKNLFSALKLERFATFIILSLAILVASFCIICTLLLMVTEKGKEIAILKAIGATDGSILRTFMIEGIIIGGIGMIFGVVTSLAFATGVEWYELKLDPDVYYIDKLPISVGALDFLAVAAAALTICAISTLYPAYAASKLRPVDGLRDG
ncbi:MAG: Lipoprotein releasing system transrane protein LolC [Labilithrix sp.]|nr:Lipoprotein releasing system transrane protein LolC [Labilithrix sp.]